MKRMPWITVEGVDGAGKSSHLSSIKKLVEDNGFAVVSTREPGGTDLGERLRDEILTTPMTLASEIFLVFASRAEHINKVILPALDNGNAVVCDRFTDSTYAYQGCGDGFPVEYIKTLENMLNKFEKSSYIKPDLTLVFDLSIEEASKRLSKTGKEPDKFESQSKKYFERVRSGYHQLSQEDPKRVKLVDSSLAWEDVNKNALKQVQKFLDDFKYKNNLNKRKKTNNKPF